MMTTSPVERAADQFVTALAHWRVERGMSKKQLAARMGFDPSYVSHVEGRRHKPTEDFARRAEAVLGAGGVIWQRFQEYDELRHARGAALHRDPTNYFAHHVKAHVLDTDGRAREGNEWLAAQTIHWSLGNNLIHHLWWHRTLMQLDLGDRASVLASYDENIRNFADPMTQATPDHYVDLQNACALLWRLEAQGLNVGHRWDELADKAEARIGEAGHLLMVPHLMMALAATGRDAAAARFLAALHELAADPQLWTAPAIADVVIPVCEAAQAHRRGQHSRVVELLQPRQAQIRLLGGSNAQRDLFFQMLVDSAMKADRRDIVSAMIAHETATRAVPPLQRAGYATATRWLHS